MSDDFFTLTEKADIRAKAAFARECADFWEERLVSGGYKGWTGEQAIQHVIAAMRQAAEANDPKPKIITPDGNLVRRKH